MRGLGSVCRSTTCFVAALSASAVAFFIGLFAASANPLLLPLLQVLPLYPAYLSLVSRGQLRRAAALVLLWALLMTLLMAWAAYTSGESLGGRVLMGESYKQEMFDWIRTGKGPEGDPSLFVVPKLREIAIFSAATFASAGFLGLLMGAILLNYMNYYVGNLLLAARPGALLQVALLSWQVYAIARVVGYTLLGVALTRVVLQLLRRRRPVLEGEVRKLLAWALALIALDFLLKAALANSLYQPLLKELTEL
uniref:Stage II sporulation protein M n=1 Tax=Thermofilum pendens TaxID=2269 RepID=A0A7C4FFF3_THEPE